ncbi:MAG: STAS domain-containing protein, partial [Bacteroidia bacterium]|nr:STAS domain-containing protein [Bacteroidia bacterium]
TLSGSLLGETERADLKNAFDAYLEKGINHFIIDLTNLQLINSNGLGVFITLYTKVRNKRGEMILCNPSQNIATLLAITKLNSVFTVAPSVEEGLKLLNKPQ